MYKVMIADDEAIVRKGLVGLVNWEELDCEIVFQAENGSAVLENLSVYQPDILICDIKMPGTDGISIARHIYENKFPTAVIILTGYADFSYARSAIQYNVVDYITKADVLSGIQSAVQKAKKSVEQYRHTTHVSRDLPLLRRNFLKSAIDGSLYDTDIETGCASYGIELGSYHVISIHFLPTAKLESTEKDKFYKSLTNFFSMSFSGKDLYHIFLDKEHFCLIMYGLCGDMRRSLFETCTTLAETLEGFMQLKVTIGISSLYNRAEDLPVAYQQASLLSTHFFMDHTKKVYTASDKETDISEVDFQNLHHLLDEISLELQNGDSEKSHTLFLSILSLLSGCSMSVFKSTGVLLQNICDKLLLSLHTSTAEQTGIPTLTENILRSSLLKDYTALMDSMLAATAACLKPAAKNQSRLVSETTAYIDRHYQEALTLVDIAEALHVNSSYLSRTFKEQTGNTIISTINQKKTEKAKELLGNLNLKIYEVAEQIGINDTTYFSHFFKKNAGMTPKEYREQL